MRPGILRALCVCLSLVAPLAVEGQPAFLVKDINTSRSGGAGSPSLSEPVEVADLQGVVLFTISDGIHGVELWRSDGTTAGTRLVKDICPGACSSSPSVLTVAGSHVFFSADDGAHGFELWKTDGTEAGTVLVKDLNPGLSGSWIASIRSLDDTVFVLDYEPVLQRSQWWRSDGTAAGTVVVANLQGVLGRLGDTLFLAFEDPAHGTELWKTDGTDAGTVPFKDIRPGTPSSDPRGGTVAGGKLFFLITGEEKTELWVTDGTEGGTVGLAPLTYFDGSDGYFGEFVALGSEVLFPAWDAAHGLELWKSDGTPTGTRLLKDIDPGTSESFPHAFANAGGKVFFVADDDVHSYEMWVSDGTEAGTVLVKDIYPGNAPSLDTFQPRIRVDVSGRLVFWADDGTHGIEPWASDGTADGTSLLADIVPGPDSSYYHDVYLSPPSYVSVDDRFAAVGGRLYFRPFLGSEEPEIWTTDGTAAGTGPLLEIDTQTSSLRLNRQGRQSATDLNGVLVFPADDGMTGAEPWRSDGTEAGTFLLQDISGPFSFAPDGFIRLGNDAIFVARPYGWLWKTNGVAGAEDLGLYEPDMSEPTPMGEAVFVSTGSGLFRSDGTAAGTLRVGPEGPTKNPTRAGDSLLFYTRKNPALGVDELWKVEVAFNTSAVRDAASGGPANPDQLTMAGSLLFFSAREGSELWKSDGTAAGTVLLEKAGPGETFQIPRIYGSLYFSPKDVRREVLAPAGSVLLFVASDGASGYELWKSDGTTAGTGLLKDVFPGARGSEPSDLTVAGHLVYFVADDGVHGRELWVSDGTALGTRLVEDVNPGPGSSTPQQLRHLRNTLLFAADDGIHGLEPWVSDGTVATTSLLQDIAPGALASSPLEFTLSGPRIYFGASDGTHGSELWALPKTAVGSTFADVTRAHWAWSPVEALATAGITLGCAPGLYCPGSTVPRAEMAVFLGRAIHGGSFVPPPATGTRFQDVPAGHWAAAWIEQIATDGVTQGCSSNPPLFCVGFQVTRAEMAILLLRAKHGGSYTPPPATGTRFEDVPAAHWAASWIEQLAAEGISLGCTPTRFCPGNLVTRAEMAVFLDRAFGLSM